MKRIARLLILVSTVIATPASGQLANDSQCRVWGDGAADAWSEMQEYNSRIAIMSRPDYWRIQYIRLRDAAARNVLLPDFNSLAALAGMPAAAEACDAAQRSLQNALMEKLDRMLNSGETVQRNLEKADEARNRFVLLTESLRENQCERRILDDKSRTEVEKIDPVVGCWDWSWVMLDGSQGKAVLTLDASGGASLSAFGLRGRWSCTGEKCRIDWGRGPGNEDVLTQVGGSMAGKNTQTKSIMGRKTTC